MALRVKHIESDKVGSSLCVASSIALLAAALVALIKLGEYVATQIATMF